MFEKEAEEYRKENLCKKCHNHCRAGMCTCSECKIKTFKDGAALGYNKANEWYKVADGTIPKENKLYLVQIKDNGLAIAYFNGQHWETRYNLGESGHCVETVIAWREIPTFEE